MLLLGLLAAAGLGGAWWRGWLSWERARLWLGASTEGARRTAADGGVPSAEAGEAGAPEARPGPEEPGASPSRDGAATGAGDAAVGDPAEGAPAGSEPDGPEVCPLDAPEPRLAVVQLLAGETPELLLACKDRIDAFGWSPAWQGLLRFAVFRIDPEVPDVLVEPTRPAAGDVTGDGHPDLLLGFTFRGDGGAAVGGALHLVPQRPDGGFGEPRRLASAPVLALTVSQLDGRSGHEALAVLRGERLGGQRAELRGWRGGVPLEPMGRRALPGELTGATWFDLDGDGNPDLLGAAPGRLLAVLLGGQGDLGRAPLLEQPVASLRAVAAAPLGWAALVGAGVRLPARGAVVSSRADGGASGWVDRPLGDREAGPGKPLSHLGEAGSGLWAAGQGRAWFGRFTRSGELSWEALPIPAGEVASVALWRDRTWVLWRSGASRPWKLLAVGRGGATAERMADAPLVVRVTLP